VLVLAAVAVTLTQARAAWLALTPNAPARQRVVAGIIGLLCLAISATAMTSHLLEAQRAKSGDEVSDRSAYDNKMAELTRKTAELDQLGTPRPVAVIQAEVQAAKIEPWLWRRSVQCSDVTEPESKKACAPILDLYKERGNAARKLELAPEVDRLTAELASMKRPEKAQETEETVASFWGWLMGIGVVVIATFGTVLFARVEVDPVRPAPADTAQTSFPMDVGALSAAVYNPPPEPPATPPKPRKRQTRKERVQDSIRAHTLKHGAPPKFKLVMGRHRLPKATASRYLNEVKQELVS